MSTKLEYQKVGDYSLPRLSGTEGKPLRRWGRMRRDYLREHRPVLLNQLVVTGKLWEYLNTVDDEVDARMELLVEQMKQAEGITEELKERDQLRWVGLMNNIRACAEEIVKEEIIFT